MLNRRILRIKAFQILFSYAGNRSMTLEEALAALDGSCEATRDLYLLMLSIVGPLTAEAARRTVARHRFREKHGVAFPDVEEMAQIVVELRDHVGRGALLRAEDLRRAGRAGKRVADVAGGRDARFLKPWISSRDGDAEKRVERASAPWYFPAARIKQVVSERLRHARAAVDRG